ncbi:RNA polymerase sigma-70 factor [Flavivirga amylovorans]|uniref:RNA polymerase sigma-70 factor n=1 Tax=Flavivirga amylovorans TaxID=870486 RepID=A0ABT8X021_9FLAO|nr:RNA polymerase sigma-70 factor [Flavivirga amylovorans]MDO5987068.1 RNA polymerase sigma-70 factor [Flavivirga amylovorans]
MNFKNHKFLSEKLKSGDEKAYDFLMDSFYTKLCSYARSLTNDREKAEDIVQNVMVTIWTNRKKINYNTSIRNYLYKSVYNEFIAQFKKNAKVIYLEKKYIEAIDLVIDNEHLDIDTLMQIVNKEINNLPSKCKEVFLLNKKEGLTHIEISEYLNISVKTIEGHITRAFKILNKKLGDKVKPILYLLFGFKNGLKAVNITHF